ncbi:MAG: flavodoxin, partial [Mycetocola sp.]
ASRVVERLDAELSETDADGRPILYDKVALVAVVGNEDGAHKISADLFQALNDYGYTIPAQGVSYWNGEAMHTTDYKDLDSTPEVTASALSAAVSNAVHLAGLLKTGHYPKTD